MTGTDLFVQLVLRLGHHADAAVLWVLIKERAEVKELKITSMLISHVQLAGLVDRSTAHRSIKSLQARGLIKARVHRKTATLITVDQDAVLELLRTPLDPRLPGLSRKVFPFLDAWSRDQRDRAESVITAVSRSIAPAPCALGSAESNGLVAASAAAASIS
ncbi:MAG: hypothetical protein DI587_14490 [Variovorax paradoxus]|nr:MAG: hypothetical protein DI583_14490 [Variovorax paradoxus]PZQ09623.1 MAG: hypothetical protein DI587_14490 [Variovorax paradoxus]